jgi:trimethylamine--corrinoid protein Co-methyltransferase
MMEGIRVDREYLALEAIKRVGPGGHFLGDQHTLTHFRENWKPGITDRRTYDQWKARGATTMGQRAKQKVQQILESHQPQPLSAEVNEQIDRILTRIEPENS